MNELGAQMIPVYSRRRGDAVSVALACGRGGYRRNCGWPGFRQAQGEQQNQLIETGTH